MIQKEYKLEVLPMSNPFSLAIAQGTGFCDNVFIFNMEKNCERSGL
jgi:hypothetical protein